MIVSQSAGVLQNSFADMWYTVAQLLPSILAAVIIFIIGWIVGIVLYRVVEQVAKVLRIDEALKAAGLNEAAREAGVNLNVGAFLGTLVQWFVVIVFLMTSLEILGFSRVTVFLPQVIVAVLILVLAAVVAEAAKNIIAGSARAAGSRSGNLAGTVAKYAIWVTAILAVLNQLGVATEFVQTLFTGIVVSLALGFGLAFGLGGKEAAARTIERVRSEITHSH